MNTEREFSVWAIDSKKLFPLLEGIFKTRNDAEAYAEAHAEEFGETIAVVEHEASKVVKP